MSSEQPPNRTGQIIGAVLALLLIVVAIGPASNKSASAPEVPAAAPSPGVVPASTARATPDRESAAQAEAVIVDHCKAEWPTDYEMRAYCVRKQREAFAQLNSK